MLVVPTWCRATSPPKAPKPTIEAMAIPLLKVLARAIARALGIFSGALGFWFGGRCVCARFCGSANSGLPSCDVMKLLVYGEFCGGMREARVSYSFRLVCILDSILERETVLKRSSLSSFYAGETHSIGGYLSIL